MSLITDHSKPVDKDGTKYTVVVRQDESTPARFQAQQHSRMKEFAFRTVSP
ncbi:hypothetical protein [Burkholderia thailandensis]|uniref:hypothetical protein n=1 Tax=Burkholderia thailandensis TaxID=57975 RepID=UPI0029903FE9|nr:hypothetical protein [Burkholderia thailandensis]MDW9241426.1 hypothetical protein [Burkholderia thailandensis]